VSFKLDQSAIDWIDRLASERGENRSETMRAMLAFALQADAARLAPPRRGACRRRRAPTSRSNASSATGSL
jgi:Arc/MetJ-type ribon-helix-helix transcriptional regulator